MKAIKQIIAVLAAAVLLAATQVTAHEYNFSPGMAHRIQVNSCGGGVIGYANGVAKAVTALHCVKAPSSVIYADGDFGALDQSFGDLAIFSYRTAKEPFVLPMAMELPKPGERVWTVTQDFFTRDYLPVPGVWVNVKSDWRDNPVWVVYGGAMRGFSGSPVLNEKGEILGVVSIGYFIEVGTEDEEEVEDIRVAEDGGYINAALYAPWSGISLLPHLEPK